MNFESIFSWFIKFVPTLTLLYQNWDIYFGSYDVGVIVPFTI